MVDEKELGKALKEGQNRIEIEGDLAKKVFKIITIDEPEWTVCSPDISTRVRDILYRFISRPIALSEIVAEKHTEQVLGVETRNSAILIAKAAGGAEVLDKLRDYKLQKISDNYVILTK